jgi:large subunit ribosomal protein L14e
LTSTRPCLTIHHPYSVEVGRVVLIEEGPYAGKLCSIVEVVDAKRVRSRAMAKLSKFGKIDIRTQALVDGPTTSVPRQVIAYKKVILTPYVLKKLPRGARSPTVAKVWKASEIDAKWENSSWNKKRQIRQTRKSLTDFDRFKVQALKTQRRKLVAKG